MIRATPKRERERLPKDPDLDVDSLSLLLSWGGEEKCASAFDVVADEVLVREAEVNDAPGSDSVLDRGLDKTCEKRNVAKVLVLLVTCALMMVLLLWYGIILIPATMVWN